MNPSVGNRLLSAWHRGTGSTIAGRLVYAPCEDELVRHLESVVFDLGETPVDETRQWSEWADWLGVSTFTLFGAMGAAIADRRHHLEAFVNRPGFVGGSGVSRVRRSRDFWSVRLLPLVRVELRTRRV